MTSLGQTEKKCPFCAELVKQEAIVCRYCSRDLPLESVDRHVEGKVACRQCSTKMLQSTAKKYNGYCALCAKNNGFPRKESQQKATTSTAPKCAKCGSTVITYNKKGFSAGKAVLGAVAFAGIGLLLGLVGSNKIRATCCKCGNSWNVS
jgi:hypothetical protein